jgi:hypothetical protein
MTFNTTRKRTVYVYDLTPDGNRIVNTRPIYLVLDWIHPIRVERQAVGNSDPVLGRELMTWIQVLEPCVLGSRRIFPCRTSHGPDQTTKNFGSLVIKSGSCEVEFGS